MDSKKEKLKKELQSFQKLWAGGTTLAKDSWEKTALARLEAGTDINKIYEICIEPYMNDSTDVLEIGTNGGGWARKLLGANSLTCLDALSAEHTGFWNNIQKSEKVKYFKVEDFSCDCLEENSIDYVFSYDVFCHISYSGTEEYLKNLYSKLKKGANCFIMIADSGKYTFQKGRSKHVSLMSKYGFDTWDKVVEDYDGEPYPGRWYFYDTEMFCDLLEKYDYEVVERDVVRECDQYSPIIHFRKG